MVAQRTPVDLKVWGLTKWDADRGRQDATIEAAERDWDIVDVQESTGSPNPLRPRDYSSLHRGERFNRAWVFCRHEPASEDGSDE